LKKKYLYNIDRLNLLKWRTVFQLSAVFVFTMLLSCKKKESYIGKNSINQNELLNSTQVDTFTLKTYTKIEDSVQTDNTITGVLGSYNDPIFGTFKSSILAHLRLPAVNPSFGDVNTIKIDSFVLGLVYVGFYGDKTPQKFEVYQLDDSIGRTTNYYTTTNKTYGSDNLLVSGKDVITPSPTNKIVIDTAQVNAQLRLYLDTNLARNFLNQSVNNPTTFSSNDNFINYFKGLYIGVDNTSQSPGTGGISYFDLADPLTKLTIYYHQTGADKQKTYDFLINAASANYTKADINNTGTSVENAFENSQAGLGQFYTQALKSRAVVSIPGIKNLSKKAIIHQALLYLPIEYQTGSSYSPSAEISISTKLEKSSKYFNIGLATYDEVEKRYIIDLKSYIQSILSDQRYPVSISAGTYNALIEGTELFITPRYFNNSAERIIFNGTKTTNKNKPKLILKYTEF